MPKSSDTIIGTTPMARLVREGASSDVPFLRFRRFERPASSKDKKGTVESLYYTATAIEGAPQKRALVYLPYGYSPEKQYGLLILLHGIGGDETEWIEPAVAGPSNCLSILDTLMRGEIEDTVVVFPNGRTCKNFEDKSSGAVSGFMVETPENVRGFYDFGKELRDDLIPAVQNKYSISGDRAKHALGGFSMGGMQAINFGMKNFDYFSWLGGFSCAPTTQCGVLVGLAVRESGYPVDGIYLVCGDRDEIAYPVFRSVTEGLRESAGEKLSRFVAEVMEDKGHDFEVWNHALEAFLRLAFPKAAEGDL